LRRSTGSGEIFSKSTVWEKCQKQVSLFWRYPNFLLTQRTIHRFDRTTAVTDRQTDRHRTTAYTECQVPTFLYQTVHKISWQNWKLSFCRAPSFANDVLPPCWRAPIVCKLQLGSLQRSQLVSFPAPRPPRLDGVLSLLTFGDYRSRRLEGRRC